MTSRQLRLIPSPTRHPHLALCVTAWTLVSIGISESVTVAWGQGERSHTVVTEIWMSGEDLAVTRRIPQDRRSAQHSYNDVARSMVNIAESRYRDRDEETAEWLHQWARKLTDGRIGNKPRAASRQQQAHEVTVPTMTQPEVLENEYFAPSALDFDSTELAIEWPISAFTEKSTPDETQSIAHESELLRELQLRDDRLELVSQQETKGEQSADGEPGRSETRFDAYVGTVAVTHANSDTQPSRRSELVVPPQEKLMDGGSRQVALVPTNMQQGLANHLPRDVPTAPAEKLTMLALSCFAAGVVCCFVLHTLLLLTPVRLTDCRRVAPPSQTLDSSLAQVTLTRESLAPARAVAFSTRPHTPARDLSQQRDKAGSMVEEFYNSNIAIFESFAQLGD